MTNEHIYPLQGKACPSGWITHSHQEGDDMDRDSHMFDYSMDINRNCDLDNRFSVEDKLLNVIVTDKVYNTSEICVEKQYCISLVLSLKRH